MISAWSDIQPSVPPIKECLEYEEIIPTKLLIFFCDQESMDKLSSALDRSTWKTGLKNVLPHMLIESEVQNAIKIASKMDLKIKEWIIQYPTESAPVTPSESSASPA